MKQTQIIMGMPITIEIADENPEIEIFEKIFNYFKYIDEVFSTYKNSSQISLINQKKLKRQKALPDVQKIFKLSEETKKITNGFFDIKKNNGQIDPSGLVKGWAILNAAKIIKKCGYKNFYVDAGSDIEIQGKNKQGQPWQVGIKNPFDQAEIVKLLKIENKGVATSGNYIRGDHIYNPKTKKRIDEIVSLTVIGPNIYEADRFATAAFAMGKQGIEFIEKLAGFEAYLIDSRKIAKMTSGFEKYTA